MKKKIILIAAACLVVILAALWHNSYALALLAADVPASAAPAHAARHSMSVQRGNFVRFMVNSFFMCLDFLMEKRLLNSSDGVASPFAGPDPDAFLHREDEDFSVSDVSCACAGNDPFHGFFYKLVIHADGETHFLVKIHFDFRSAIRGNISFLLTAAQCVRDGNFEDFPCIKFLFHGVQPFGFDVGDDQFHGQTPFLPRISFLYGSIY